MTRTGPRILNELYAALGEPESGQSLITPDRVGWLRRVIAESDLMDAQLGASMTVTEVRREPDGPGLLLLTPHTLGAPAPVVVLIHGGAMIAGSARSGLTEWIDWCVGVGAALVSIDYRLAPEHPYPTPVEDCLWALGLVRERADEWGINSDHIVLAGGSAGANLVAACVLRLADVGGSLPAAVMMWQPMLDDRLESPSSHELVADAVLDRASVQTAWDLYLGGRVADQFAAPARASRLADFPPTFLEVGQVDIFRDETLEFASRLSAAGVLVELHLWPGAYHGFEGSAPTAHISALALAARKDFARRGLWGRLR